MALDFNVNLAPQVAMQMIDNGIVNGSLSGERIDYYEVHNTAGYLCITAVYEKYYYPPVQDADSAAADAAAGAAA